MVANIVETPFVMHKDLTALALSVVKPLKKTIVLFNPLTTKL